jgi:hypothetical protein
MFRADLGNFSSFVSYTLFLSQVLYYENIEGGHGGAADNQQQAFMSALGWQYLFTVLKGAEKEQAKI